MYLKIKMTFLPGLSGWLEDEPICEKPIQNPSWVSIMVIDYGNPL